MEPELVDGDKKQSGESKPEKKRPTERQLEALKRGREKRAKINHERQAEDGKFVQLQRELQSAKEENLKIREEIIQGKLALLKEENQTLEKVVKSKPPPRDPSPPPVAEEPLTIQKPSVAPPKPQKNSSFFDNICLC
jgi:hypothetical protein